MSEPGRGPAIGTCGRCPAVAELAARTAAAGPGRASGAAYDPSGRAGPGGSRPGCWVTRLAQFRSGRKVAPSISPTLAAGPRPLHRGERGAAAAGLIHGPSGPAGRGPKNGKGGRGKGACACGGMCGRAGHGARRPALQSSTDGRGRLGRGGGGASGRAPGRAAGAGAGHAAAIGAGGAAGGTRYDS